MNGPRAVDCHTHILPQRAIDLVQGDPRYGVTISGLRVWQGRPDRQTSIPKELVQPAAKLGEMDGAGVAKAVVAPFVGLFMYQLEAPLAERLCEVTNEGLAEFCQAAPRRLRWMANLPFQHPALARQVLKRARRAGCVGVEMGARVGDMNLDDPALEEVWSDLEAKRLPVFVHSVSSSGPPEPALAGFHLANVIGNPLQATVAAERLIVSGLLDRHPGLRVLIAHGGGFFPYQAGRLRHAAKVRPELAGVAGDPLAYAGRLMFDTITHDPLALAYLISRVGAENVLMGTDMPFDMGTRTPVAEVLGAVSGQEAELVLHLNAERLFGLQDS